MSFDPKEPYNDLPLLPPKGEIETPVVLRKCVTASRALAELKGAGHTIPNQSILINAIPLQEAKLSSEIENIVTTQDELYSAAIGTETKSSPQTKEVLRYRTALWQGYQSIQQGHFNLKLFEQLCSTILDEAVSCRSSEGVYIGNVARNTITYTPPRGSSVIDEKMRNLYSFIEQSCEFDPLICTALAHYQFEAIHPFLDGNGRTGRIVSILQLVRYGLLDIPVLYLSKYIVESKQEYYLRLRAVTEDGDWERWILFILSAIEETAITTRERIEDIGVLLAETIEYCRTRLSKRVYSKELIELIFVQPYCKIRFLEEAGIAKRQTASSYLQELEHIGVLESRKDWREIIYTNPALLKILSTS